jgi:hypothetical protein
MLHCHSFSFRVVGAIGKIQENLAEIQLNATRQLLFYANFVNLLDVFIQHIIFLNKHYRENKLC